MKRIKKRLEAHFSADDLGPDLIHELATVCEAVVGEVLAERARRGGLARKRALSPARRREIARRANRARRTT